MIKFDFSLFEFIQNFLKAIFQISFQNIYFMKTLVFTIFTFLFCTVTNAQINANLILKEASCKDATCECHECFYKFVDDKGKEFIFNKIHKDNTPGVLQEIDAKSILDPTLIGKKFSVQYKEGVCICLKNEKNGSYMEESPAKNITAISLLK